jgi:hypothetical protein
MDLRSIIERFRGVTVTVVTTNSALPFATGEVLDGPLLCSLLALRLTVAYGPYPVGATVFFNVNQLVSIG